VLADQISNALSKRFKIPPPPTISAKLVGNTQIAFSRFQNLESRPGYSSPPEREEAFVFNVPLAAARFSRVSINGLGQSVVQAPGKAYLFDLTSRNEISLDATYNAIRFHMSQLAIDQMAYEKGIHRVRGLYSKQLGQEDQILHRLALTLLPVIENSCEVTTAFVEYIGLAFHDHVIYTYGGIPRAHRPSGGLSPWQIRRAHEFIEANLAGDPSIAAMAAECGISTSYFTRAFRVSTGMTPHQWIIQRRVSLAKSLIQESSLPLVEIALMCGFVDQSHLGRHFTRMVGATPAKWRHDRSSSDYSDAIRATHL
jgi:AraC family transcriptional regulator